MSERCTCDAIQRADKRRHFHECPSGGPLTPDLAIDKRTAIAAAFGDLGFEYASDPDPIPDEEIREYRKTDNVHRPSREPGYRHGLVVHRLTDAWAMQRAEIASLRAALAAEREAHERQTAMWAESGSEMTTALARVSEALGEGEYDCSVTLLDVHERVRAKVMSLKATAATAIADRIAAEKERDAFRAQAEASLTVPCACGRPMPSVSSRLRCDACRAERELDQARATLRAAANRARGIAQAAADDEAALAVLGPLVAERDEARAQTAAFRQALLAVWDASSRGDAEGCPQDNNLDLTLAICATKTVTDAPDAGAPLLAELRALRAVRDAVEAWLTESDLHPGVAGHAGSFGWVVLRAALDAAKVGVSFNKTVR